MQQSAYVGVDGGAPGGPGAPGAPGSGVVYVPVPIRPGMYEAFLSGQAVGLGITQIIIGVLCIIFNVVTLLTDDYNVGTEVIGHGFWCGALFIITGGLGVGAGVRKTKCQIVGFMVMCIISAIFTISLLTIASIGATISNVEECSYYGYNYDRDYYYPYFKPPCYKMNNYKVVVAMEASMAILAIVEAILAIWGSAICCKSGVCCCSRPVSAVSAIVAPPSYYQGQMIYLKQTPGGQNVYMQQAMNTHNLGMVGPPFYASNYVQPNWTYPSIPQIQPPYFASPPKDMDETLPAYSPQNEGPSGAADPQKF